MSQGGVCASCPNSMRRASGFVATGLSSAFRNIAEPIGIQHTAHAYIAQQRSVPGYTAVNAANPSGKVLLSNVEFM